MNHVERRNQAPSRRTGLFATLSAFLRVQGSGARLTRPGQRGASRCIRARRVKQIKDAGRDACSAREGSRTQSCAGHPCSDKDAGRVACEHASGRGRRDAALAAPGQRGASSSRTQAGWRALHASGRGRRDALPIAVLVAAFALALLAPSAALAHFTRPFLPRIAGHSGGLALDGADSLWVSELGNGQPPYKLSEFASAGLGNGFLKTLEIEGVKHNGGSLGEFFTVPSSLAVNDSSGAFYVDGGNTQSAGSIDFVEAFNSAGVFSFDWGPLEFAEYVAVDNSSNVETKGDVYVSGNGVIRKFNAAGTPENFSGFAGHEEYISGSEITGVPGEHGVFGPVSPLAVDSHGNIFAVSSSFRASNVEVAEFAPSGVLLRSFTGKETPGVGPTPGGFGGFGGPPQGVAVDPINGHVLVGVHFQGGGVIDEFDEEGHFLSQIVDASPGSPLSDVGGMAADSKGDVYVSDFADHAVIVYGPGRFLPSFKLAEASQRKPTTAVLSGEVDPEGFPLTECRFDYVSEAAFKANVANEVQTVTLSGATGGAFTLGFKGQTTAAIPFNATAAGVRAALGALSTIGSSNLAVTGSAGGPYTVEFQGSLAHTAVPQLTADSSALTPPGATVTPATTTEGGDGWGTAAAAPCVPAAASIEVDKSFHPVQAALTGLTSGVTYRYRLTATSSGELGGTGESNVLAFTAPHAPRVDSTSAGNLSSTFADLRARIDPLGAGTAYRFEYLTQAAFEANGGSFSGPDAAASVPVPDAGIGSGGETGGAQAAVVQPIGGLSPATAYRFRVVATNEIGVAAGEVNGGGEEVAHTFATLPSPVPGLPDGRAYELVTPVDKGTADDMFSLPLDDSVEFQNKDVGFASESGGGFLLETRAAFGASPAGEFNAYVFSRGSAGWRTASLASPSLGVQNIPGTVFDPFDLSRVGVDDTSGSFASPAGAQRLSLLGAPGGPYAKLHADTPLTGQEHGEATTIVGGSRDLGHVVLESYGHTLAAAPGAEKQDAGTHALYESSGAGECGPETANCTLVNVNSEGTLLNRCGAVLGLGSVITGGTHGAVSADGSRVFFTAPDPTKANDGPGCWNGAAVNTPQLYLRTGAQTVEVSEPEPGAPEATRHPAIYVGASEDGSRVFFLSEGELTKDDAGIHDAELYEYDLAKAVGERLTRVSRGESGSAAGGVRTVPAVSADGSAVYFMANGLLASNQGADGTHASPGNCIKGVGTCSLYRYDTNTATTTYLATVEGADYPVGGGSFAWWNSLPAMAPEPALESGANWYTTPDGRFLLFASTRELTGYNTAQAPGSLCLIPISQGGHNGHCDEVYRYDSATASLSCVSCNPSGAPPVSNALFARSAIKQPSSGPVRAMSDDGSYVFFDTADALVPQDKNKTLDVYEWHNGRVSLISSGKDKAPSFFLGQSAAEIGGVHVEAANVFFGTHASLVPQDTGGSGDLYDARICAQADPCIKPPAGETAQCEGDACQNPPPAPIDATPGSLTFSGAGNLLLQALPPPAGKTAAQIRAEKLTKALKTCRKKPKKKRAACEKQARKKYATKASRPSKRKG